MTDSRRESRVDGMEFPRLSVPARRRPSGASARPSARKPVLAMLLLAACALAPPARLIAQESPGAAGAPTAPLPAGPQTPPPSPAAEVVAEASRLTIAPPEWAVGGVSGNNPLTKTFLASLDASAEGGAPALVTSSAALEGVLAPVENQRGVWNVTLTLRPGALRGRFREFAYLTVGDARPEIARIAVTGETPTKALHLFAFPGGAEIGAMVDALQHLASHAPEYYAVSLHDLSQPDEFRLLLDQRRRLNVSETRPPYLFLDDLCLTGGEAILAYVDRAHRNAHPQPAQSGVASGAAGANAAPPAARPDGETDLASEGYRLAVLSPGVEPRGRVAAAALSPAAGNAAEALPDRAGAASSLWLAILTALVALSLIAQGVMGWLFYRAVFRPAPANATAAATVVTGALVALLLLQGGALRGEEMASADYKFTHSLLGEVGGRSSSTGYLHAVTAVEAPARGGVLDDATDRKVYAGYIHTLPTSAVIPGGGGSPNFAVAPVLVGEVGGRVSSADYLHAVSAVEAPAYGPLLDDATNRKVEAGYIHTLPKGPGDPAVASTSHPNQAVWSSNATPDFSSGSPPNTDHFHWLIDQTPTRTAAYVAANGTQDADGVVTGATGVSGDGTWYIHVVASDSPTDINLSRNPSHYTIKYDGSTPNVAWVDAGPSAADRVSYTTGQWVSAVSASFSWSHPGSVSGVTFYYEVNTSPGATIAFDEATTTASAFIDGVSLGAGSNYFHVAAKNGAGTTGAEQVFRLNSDTTTPAIAWLDAGPSSGDRASFTSGQWTNDSLVSFSWADPASISDDTFYYELNTSSGNTIAFDEATTTASAFVDNVAISAGVNYFHVAPKNGVGATGGEVVYALSFDGATPDIAQVRAWQENTFATEITADTWQDDGVVSFNWTDPASPSDDFFYYEYNQSAADTISGSESSTAAPQVTDFALTAGDYFFHVKPKTNAGAWGTERTFRVKYNAAAPGAPTALWVNNGVTGAQSATAAGSPPTIRGDFLTTQGSLIVFSAVHHDDAGSAEKYQVQVDDDDAAPYFESPLWDSGAAGTAFPEGAQSVTDGKRCTDVPYGSGAAPAAQLSYGVTYSWRVRLWDAVSPGPWSTDDTTAPATFRVERGIGVTDAAAESFPDRAGATGASAKFFKMTDPATYVFRAVVEAGAPVTLTFWARNPSGTTLPTGMSASFTGLGVTPTGPTFIQTSPDDANWRQHQFTATAPASRGTLLFTVTTTGAGPWYFDDIVSTQ
ncbi:MAG: hypothetical protein HY719_13260 [Planctomycetes bacterium]|nr:hypothetical protein [Planctomycetota bacterium]